MNPDVTALFHSDTFTITYLVADPENGRAAIIDPVLDFDQKSGRATTVAADKLIALVREKALAVEWILETHAHADHLSAADYLKSELGAKTGIGQHITEVQGAFKTVFNLNSGFKPDGSQFDHLFKDGETFAIGGLEASVMHTPGHTPACITYVVGDAAFVGDTLFMPDFGTARTDFPGGDARVLFRSIHKVLALPPETRLFMCHDYAPGDRDYAWESSVAEERAKNIHVHDGVTEDEFVKMRTERDATLEVPQLILPSIQVNIRAGHMPEPEDNGVAYLKLPINAL